MNQPKTILEVIQAVDDGFDDEDKWTKGAYAKDKYGTRCPEGSPLATCHCLAGKVIQLTETPGTGIANKVGSETLTFISKFIRSTYKASLNMIHEWNDADERTFQDVKNLLKNAKANLSNENFVP